MPKKLVDVSFLYKYLKINKLVTHGEFYNLPYSAAYQLVTSHHAQNSDEKKPVILNDWRNQYIAILITKIATNGGLKNG